MTDDRRAELKNAIAALVGYPCKIACKPNNGSVDIYVFSEKKRRVVDWIEVQPHGAVGVIYDCYDDPDCAAVDKVDSACDAYNMKCAVEFDDDSDSSSDESGDSEEVKDKEQQAEV